MTNEEIDEKVQKTLKDLADKAFNLGYQQALNDIQNAKKNIQTCPKTTKKAKKIFYAVKADEDDPKKNIVVFASQKELNSGEVSGYGIPSDFSILCDLLEDDGMGCEDYLITTKKNEVNIDIILLARGFVKSEELKDCGWC